MALLEASYRTALNAVQLGNNRLAALLSCIHDEVWFTNTERRLVWANSPAPDGNATADHPLQSSSKCSALTELRVL